MNANDCYSLGFHLTCSIDNPIHNGIVYAKDRKYLEQLANCDKRVFAFVPRGWREILHADPNCNVGWLPQNVSFNECDDPLLEWAMIHNEIHRVRLPTPNIIDPSAIIHPSAQIGIDGARYIEIDSGLLGVIHVGNVVIHEDVSIAANTVIHRALLDSTIIHQGARIGSLCNIGHNVEIGAHTIATAAVKVGGSTRIGERAFLGLGCVISNGLEICDRAFIGAGAVIVKDIKEPGVYAGNPAKCIRGYNPNGYGA